MSVSQQKLFNYEYKIKYIGLKHQRGNKQNSDNKNRIK
jgi:hypothetical protein